MKEFESNRLCSRIVESNSFVIFNPLELSLMLLIYSSRGFLFNGKSSIHQEGSSQKFMT